MRCALLLTTVFMCVADSPTADIPNKSQPPPRLTPTAASSSTVPTSQLRLEGNVYVGELAPDFTLTSAGGRELALSHLRGHWVLVHFVPNRRDFAALRAAQEDLAQMGVILLGVCKDNPQSLRVQAQRDSVTFELLADATGEVSALYGLYDATQFSSRAGLVVVDRTGKTRLTLMGTIPPQHLADMVRFAMLGVVEGG